MAHDKTMTAEERRAEEKAKLKGGTIQQAMRDRMDGDKHFSDLVELAWSSVAKTIHERALKADPRPANFEVHHELEVSKDAFLITLHETDDIEKAREIGIGRTAAQPAAEPAAVEDEMLQP